MPSTEEAQAQKEKEKRNKNQKAELEWSGGERTLLRGQYLYPRGVFALVATREHAGRLQYQHEWLGFNGSQGRSNVPLAISRWIRWVQWLQVNQPSGSVSHVLIRKYYIQKRANYMGYSLDTKTSHLEALSFCGSALMRSNQSWGSGISFMSHEKMSTKWRHMRLNNDANMGKRPLRIRCNLELSDRGSTDRVMM